MRSPTQDVRHMRMRRGGASTRSGMAEGRRRAVVLSWGSLPGLLLVACTSSLDTAPRLELVSPSDGYKMLRPNQSVTQCRSEGPGAEGNADDLVQEAFNRLLAIDEEA